MPPEDLDILETIQVTRDPYNYERVAKDYSPEVLKHCDDLGLGVDYRTNASPDNFAHRLTVVKLIAIPLSALAITLGARILSPWTTSLFTLGVITLLSFVFAIRSTTTSGLRLIGPNPIARFIGILALGPIVWLVITLSTFLETPALAVGVPFLVAIAAAAYLADDIAEHYAAWAAAGPRVPDRVRRAWLRAWRSRWLAGAPTSKAPGPLRPVLADYLKRILFVGLAYVAAVVSLRLVPDTLLGGLAAGSVALLAFVAVLVLAAPDPRRHPPRTILRAVSNYLTYSPQSALAPGVFRSPAGSGAARHTKLFLVLAAITFAIPAMALYFPIGLIASDPGPWHRAAERAEWVESLPGRVTEEDRAQRMSRAEVRDRLTESQRAYLESLAGTNARNAYLDRLRGATSSGRSQLLVAYITRTPETWLMLAVVGLTTLEPVFVWSLLASIALSLAVPLGTLLLVVYAIAGHAVAAFDGAFVGDEATHARRTDEPAWKECAARLRSSPSPLVREHLWLGTSAFNDYPVFLHRRSLEEHAHILGDTGSGKTSRGLAPLVSQLIASAPRTASYPGHSVVVIDLKGEPYFFNSTRVDARSAGLPFRWFTNVNGRSTYVFNPFLQSHVQDLSTHQFAEVLLQSLGLEYGEAYGPSHYSRMNRRVLQKAMQVHSEDGKGELDSFRQLEGILASKQVPFNAEEKRDATDVFAVIESLARNDAINVTQADVAQGRVDQKALDNAIDMSAFLTDPQVGYFYFSSTLETSSVRELAKLALFSLLTAADALERAHGPGHRVYVVIDEFQQIIASNLELVLRQARSKNISCILANQSMSDLKSGGIDVVPTVQANTRVRQYFAASDLKQQEMIEQSGGYYHMLPELLRHPIEELAFDLGPFGPPDGDTFIAGQLSRDEVIAMTDDPAACILHVTRGSGFTQFSGYPLLMRTEYHVSESRFRRWKSKPWPPARPETIITPLSEPNGPPLTSPFVEGAPEVHSNPRIAEALAKRDRRLRDKS